MSRHLAQHSNIPRNHRSSTPRPRMPVIPHTPHCILDKPLPGHDGKVQPRHRLQDPQEEEIEAPTKRRRRGLEDGEFICGRKGPFLEGIAAATGEGQRGRLNGVIILGVRHGFEVADIGGGLDGGGSCGGHWRARSGRVSVHRRLGDTLIGGERGGGVTRGVCVDVDADCADKTWRTFSLASPWVGVWTKKLVGAAGSSQRGNKTNLRHTDSRVCLRLQIEQSQTHL
jgi:hypothetical protein